MIPYAGTVSDVEQLREQLARRMQDLRAHTLALIEPLSEDLLNRVHDPLMSPIVWDLGHIATFEDIWLAQNAFGCEPMRGKGLADVYDPFHSPRAERGGLPYLRSHEALAYLESVRERVLDLLASADLSEQGEGLLARGYVFELVLRHEMQHCETILQTLQLMTSDAYRPSAHDFGGGATVSDVGAGPEMVRVRGGEFEMGTARLVFSYDNERPAHQRRTDPFMIDRTPVANGAFLEFVADDGYDRQELWSPQGWSWLRSQGRRLPRYWRQAGDGFQVRSFARWQPLDRRLPVCHVSWYEADAYARYAGKRLPTEAEWERAASWDEDAGRKCARPWGDTGWNEEPGNRPDAGLANLGQSSFTTAPVGSYAAGASPCGALQMLGDIWEWTAGGFDAYPGFEAFPYREYSQAFFGGPFRTLRGGSWATMPEAVSTTFRNWDHPDRSQIFAGFRCARDIK